MNSKKFSEIKLADFQKLSQAVIGFEFEFYSKYSYTKTLELLNIHLAPVKVWGQNRYHSDFETDKLNWKIEPDFSGGYDMVELVTGPLDYQTARVMLLKCLKFIQKWGWTGELSGIHMNISFDNDRTGKRIETLNKLKLILNTDEDLVYKSFPNRKNNMYARSIKRLLPYKGFDYADAGLSILQQNIELPATKYYGLNFSHSNRVEVRYLGGKDYQNKVGDLLELMDYFIGIIWNSCGEALDDTDKQKLIKYLDDSINEYSAISSLDGFLAKAPGVTLQIDKRGEYELLMAYYPQLLDKLHQILTHIQGLGECVINWDTIRRRMEIVGATEPIKPVFSIRDVDFVACIIGDGEYDNCIFTNCEIKTALLDRCRTYSSELENSRLINCRVDSGCVLTKCFFAGGYFNGHMVGGVFRMGRKGEMAEFESVRMSKWDKSQDFEDFKQKDKK